MSSQSTVGSAEGGSDPPALPPVHGFRLEVHREGTAARLALTGEMDLSNVGLVDVNLASLADLRPDRLILDLRRLSFMDSSGLRLVISWVTRAAQEGLTFHVIQGGPDVRRLFEITGTLDLVTFVARDTADDRTPSVPRAIGALNGDAS